MIFPTVNIYVHFYIFFLSCMRKIKRTACFPKCAASIHLQGSPFQHPLPRQRMPQTEHTRQYVYTYIVLFSLPSYMSMSIVIT